MPLYFITGNTRKFEEVKEILPSVEHLKIDLPEVQDIDARKIIEEKLKEAQKVHDGEFIVEDTSLYFSCFDFKLPGPLVKWFEKTLGNDGIIKLVNLYKDPLVECRTIIGYADKDSNIHFFEGVLQGNLVSPRGDAKIGFDDVFEPIGSDRTYAEMSLEEKNAMSQRRHAVEKLKEHLSSNVSLSS